MKSSLIIFLAVMLLLGLGCGVLGKRGARTRASHQETTSSSSKKEDRKGKLCEN